MIGQTKRHDLLVEGNLDGSVASVVGGRRVDVKQRSDRFGWLVEGFRLLHVRVHGFPIL
jgi:hypothetical protein